MIIHTDKNGSDHGESGMNSLNNSIRSDQHGSQNKQSGTQSSSSPGKGSGNNNNSTLFTENDISRALAASDATFGGLTTERLYTGQVLDHLDDDSDDDDDDEEDDDVHNDLAERDDWMVGSGRDVDTSRSNSISSSQFQLSRGSSVRGNSRKSSDGQHRGGTATDPPQYSLQLPQSSNRSEQLSDYHSHSTSQSDHRSPHEHFDHSPLHESRQDHALALDDASNHPPSSHTSPIAAEGRKGSGKHGGNDDRRVSMAPDNRRVSTASSKSKQGTRTASFKPGSSRPSTTSLADDDSISTANDSKNRKKSTKVSINLPIPTSKKGLLDQGVVYLDETDEKGNRKQRTSETPAVEKLTNRKLQPHYKVDDVLLFCDIFASADEDFQGKYSTQRKSTLTLPLTFFPTLPLPSQHSFPLLGDLDIDEWASLFTKMDKSASVQQARLIFLKIDENNSGSLSIGELIPGDAPLSSL